MSHSFDKHGLKVQSSASRLADRLLPQLAGWIDCDDIAQDIHLAELENPQARYGKSVQAVDRGLKALGKLIGEPETLTPDSRLRPTESVALRRTFWPETLRALRVGVTRWKSQEDQTSPFRTFKVLFRLYKRGDSPEEIGHIEDVTDTRVNQIHRKAIVRFRHPQRACLLRPFLDRD